jgi:hypothetical protein
MNFNIEQYRKYYKAAGKWEKDGVWDVFRFPNGKYCFATQQRLGDNGKIQSHPLLNKKFKNTKTGNIFILDSVCIHWNHGYFYHGTLRDSKNSHTTAMIGNINSQDSDIIKSISKFNTNYVKI